MISSDVYRNKETNSSGVTTAPTPQTTTAETNNNKYNNVSMKLRPVNDEYDYPHYPDSIAKEPSARTGADDGVVHYEPPEIVLYAA